MAAPVVSAPGLAPKGKTAYFVFCETHRSIVREELMAGKEEGAKIAVAEEAKALGHKWKQLTDEQRQEYKDVAAKNKQAEQEAKGAQGGGDGDNGEVAAEAPASGPQVGLPLSVVRRIIMSDKEVGRVSKDAAVLMASAAEVFLEVLAEGCGAAAKNARPKRRTIKLDDFAHVIRSDRRFVAAGMKDVVGMVESMTAEQAEARQAAAENTKDDEGGEGEDGQAKLGSSHNDAASNRKSREATAKKPRPASAPPSNAITSFFARIPSAPVGGNS